MDNKRRIIIALLVLYTALARAQVVSHADSLGYALFIKGNYNGALKQYDESLAANPADKNAAYFAYLSAKYLNRDLQSSYYASKLDTAQLHYGHIAPFGALNAGLEGSLKFVQEEYRGTAAYTRASFANRLGWRLQLDQSVSFFGQSIGKRTGDKDDYKLTWNQDNQLEYYGKLGFSISNKLALIGAYHYVNNSYLGASYNSNIGIGGIKYAGNYFDLQGDVNWGTMVGHSVSQLNATLMLYPFGNLNFYTISRLSSLNQNGATQTIFSQTVGFKAARFIWLETSGSFGNLNNYIDADGLYIYNAVDATNLKLGETVFFVIGKHAQLQLNYTFERKQDSDQDISYPQHSVAAGLLWKF